MAFDPYSDWLGIPPGPRPPDPYTLLGLPRFERDPRRIEEAADDRLRRAGRIAPFDRTIELRELLDEIEAARDRLTAPSRRRQAKPGTPANASATVSIRRPIDAPSRPQAVAVTPQPRRSEIVSEVPPAKAEITPVTKVLERPRQNPAGEAKTPRRLAPALAIGSAAAVLLLGTVAAWRMASPPSADAPSGGSPALIVAEQAPNTRPTDEPPIADAARPPARAPVVAAKPRPAPPAAVHDEVASVSHPEPAARPVPVEAARPAFSSLADYRLPRFASGADREAYAGHVRELLYDAFNLKGAELDRHIAAAEALAPGDPFTEYAAGLALWKRLRFADAEVRLRAALGPESDPFLPAWRTSIRLRLGRNRRPEAIGSAAAFAKALEAAAESPSSRGPALASARWLGRLIVALEGLWQPQAKRAKDVAKADAEIRESLGPEAEAAYEAGRQSVREEYARRSAEVEAAVADLAIDHEDRRVKTIDDLTQARDATQDQREKVSRTAAEWKDWFDKETKTIDDELSQLSTRFQQLTVESEAATLTFWNLNEAVTLGLNAGAQNSASDNGLVLGGSISPALPGLIVARDQAMVKMKVLDRELAGVRTKAQGLVAKRQTIVATYERETKTLTAKSDSLRKWEGLLKKRADAADAETVTDTPAAKALRRRLREVDSYVPFDLDAERRNVLDALSTAG